MVYFCTLTVGVPRPQRTCTLADCYPILVAASTAGALFRRSSFCTSSSLFPYSDPLGTIYIELRSPYVLQSKILLDSYSGILLLTLSWKGYTSCPLKWTLPSCRRESFPFWIQTFTSSLCNVLSLSIFPISVSAQYCHGQDCTDENQRLRMHSQTGRRICG